MDQLRKSIGMWKPSTLHSIEVKSVSGNAGENTLARQWEGELPKYEASKKWQESNEGYLSYPT